MTSPVDLSVKYESFYLPPNLEKTYKYYQAIDRAISELSQASIEKTVVFTSLEKTLAGAGKEVAEIYARNKLVQDPNDDLMAIVIKGIYREIFQGFKAQKVRLDTVLSNNRSQESNRVRTLMAAMLDPLTLQVEPPKKIEAKGLLSKASSLVSCVKTAIVATYQFSKTVASEFVTTVKRQPKAFTASLVMFVAKSLCRSMYPVDYSFLDNRMAALSSEKLEEIDSVKNMFISVGVLFIALVTYFNCKENRSKQKAIEETEKNLNAEQLKVALDLIKRALKAEGKEDFVIKLRTQNTAIGVHATFDTVQVNDTKLPLSTIGMSHDFGQKNEGPLLHELGHVVNGDVDFVKGIATGCARVVAALLLNQSVLPIYFLDVLFPPKLSVDKDPSLVQKILPLCYIYHYTQYDPYITGVIASLFSNYFVYSSLRFHYARENESKADDFAVKHASRDAHRNEAKCYRDKHSRDIIWMRDEETIDIFELLHILPGFITASGDKFINLHFIVDLFKHGYDYSHSGNDIHPTDMSRAEKFAKAASRDTHNRQIAFS